MVVAAARACPAWPRSATYLILRASANPHSAPQLVVEIARAVAKLKTEGQSILLVEQNVKLMLALADDVAIINTGKIVFTGSAAEARNAGDALAQHLGLF